MFFLVFPTMKHPFVLKRVKKRKFNWGKALSSHLHTLQKVSPLRSTVAWKLALHSIVSSKMIFSFLKIILFLLKVFFFLIGHMTECPAKVLTLIRPLLYSREWSNSFSFTGNLHLLLARTPKYQGYMLPLALRSQYDLNKFGFGLKRHFMHQSIPPAPSHPPPPLPFGCMWNWLMHWIQAKLSLQYFRYT